MIDTNADISRLFDSSVEDLLAAYQESLEAGNKSRKTISWYMDILRRYFGFLQESNLIKPVNKLGREELRKYTLYLQNAQRWARNKYVKEENRGKLSPFSIQGHVRAIKAFWGWLLNEGRIESNPLAGYPLPSVPKELPRVLTLEQVDRLIAKIDRSTPRGMRQYCIVLLLLDTGVRISELVNMKIEDLDLNQGAIRVRGKGQKERFVPFSTDTRRQIRRYLKSFYPALCPAGSIYLFPDSLGEPITVNSQQQYLRRLAKRVGLVDIKCSPHVFRHTFATISIAEGAGTLVLKEIMGHKAASTTEKYAHLQPLDLQRRHASFSPVTKLLRRNNKNL